VTAGDETVGLVLALAVSRNGLPRVEVDRSEVLSAAALAALTELAVLDARDEVAGELRGSLIEDLRSRAVEPAELVRRAARLGTDLSAGAVALVAEVRTERPRHAAALVTGDHPGALAEIVADEEAGRTRVFALLPARPGEEGRGRVLDSARRIEARLRPHGPAALSSFSDSPGELARAVAEAELMLDVIARDERMASRLREGLGDGVYRLLFRALASDPEEVRRFYLETVEPLVGHDREYRTDLLGTLESYLANDCNMNATARAVYAHRHTVAHRLGRIRELTGLDPSLGEDRERLGLGLKAYRILEPTLPR
jgi:sugar diacid utilization regulator